MKGPHPGGRAGHEARAARRRLGTGANIVRSVTPEMLAERERLLRSPFVSQPPVQAAIADLTAGRGAGASPAAPATRWPPKSRYSMPQAIWIC
jgi:phosphoribosyl-dephospho-CoA transferase